MIDNEIFKLAEKICWDNNVCIEKYDAYGNRYDYCDFIEQHVARCNNPDYDSDLDGPGMSTVISVKSDIEQLADFLDECEEFFAGIDPNGSYKKEREVIQNNAEKI